MIIFVYYSLSLCHHLKFLWQSPHWAPFPEAGGLPVTRDLLHCLQRATPQLLHFILSEDPHPDENLHIFFYIF
jgi:hypothetical protein